MTERIAVHLCSHHNSPSPMKFLLWKCLEDPKQGQKEIKERLDLYDVRCGYISSRGRTNCGKRKQAAMTGRKRKRVNIELEELQSPVYCEMKGLEELI
ncbi:hypothetical protein NDU88_003647 [Pleurodeles waltl]|uniref:Uncharacterized protein n=1 Tax=Pleurodeles waltl TaxID=8319 RepID=A0AAV7L4G3_PLEWA|nr:hypothetical protein NDU88_003647 [Pleurodeles waltl]